MTTLDARTLQGLEAFARVGTRFVAHRDQPADLVTGKKNRDGLAFALQTVDLRAQLGVDRNPLGDALGEPRKASTPPTLAATPLPPNAVASAAGGTGTRASATFARIAAASGWLDPVSSAAGEREHVALG